MRIKRLEIVGFKSFCDRTVLQFDQPVTGVVGPNGCGKSNVVDAIRWCMGEQSAKHLRGKAMEDVIFAGSDTRGKSGMCEVSLTFENDGRVPIDFLAFSEITITRRLYRDGTSEYYINKTPCRLRDITDFFLGTGVGVRAYSIIEQGRIGMIVSSKPEDRRVLIEEAAGITKFKIKKKAAEKKMEFTRQNLLRVSDVITEIEKQLGSLRRQAQKAERYKQYKAEVRDIELWQSSQRWMGYAAEERVAQAALEDATTRKSDSEQALVAREATIEASRLEAAEEARRIEGLQEKLYELDNRIRLGEAQAEHESKQARSLDERVASAEREVELLAAQIGRASEELQRLSAEAKAAEEGNVGQVELLAEADETVRVLKGKLAEAQVQVDAAKAQIGQAQQDIARGEAAERSLLRRVEDLELRVARAAEERARLRGREGELQRDTGDLEESLEGMRVAKRDVQAGLAGLEARLGQLKDEIARGDKALGELTAELHKRRSRAHSLKEIEERYEGFARGTRVIMKQRASEAGERWGIRGLVADVVQAPPEFEVAVEAALGDKLGSVVVESHEAGVDGIEYLKAKREGRTSFVPLKVRAGEPPAELVPEVLRDDDGAVPGVRGRMLDLVRCDEDYLPIARALLGDVTVVDDLLSAVDLWRAGAQGTLVTLEGEVLDARGIVSGGSRDAHHAGVLQQKRELRELEGVVAELAARHEAETARMTALRAERTEKQAQLEALRKESHQREIEILGAEKDLARLREELSRLVARARTTGSDLDDLTSQRDEAVLEAEETRLGLKRAREALLVGSELREQRGREMVSLIDRLEEASSRLTEIKVRTAQVEEKRRATVRAVMQAETQKRDNEERRARLQKQITEGAAEATALRGMATARRGELVELSAESRAMADELSRARAGYEARRASLSQAEAELKTSRQAAAHAAQALASLEVKLREARMNRAHLEEHVMDRYRLRIEETLHDYHLRPLAGDKEDKRLRELRDLIDRMGEINLTAIEEYQVLEQRYTFLLNQKQDLEQALAQLEEAIAQINRTSRKRFREVFDLVNQKFQELFPRLFHGGRAYLSLTNADDVLESGIEIFAQPPGKKNATVELLSGGEKALTACSLVFAIFLIKPSPFCLLDEVDAPLDEANVGRYNDLLRAMTDRTQFIVITHNKRTMEITDTLYGVTMEEPGVSKLVSVNLSTAGGAKRAA